MDMNPLVIEKTKSSPQVRFDPAADVFEISGQSYPENAARFYEPVIAWIDDYVTGSEAPLVLDIRLIYLNTSSSKMILTLLDRLEAHHQESKEVSVRWYYDEDNEMAQECGEEFSEDLTIPFALIEDRT
jgi:hypothetical protein